MNAVFRSPTRFLGFLLASSLLCAVVSCSRTPEGGKGDSVAQNGRSATLSWTTDQLEAIRLNAQACALIDRYDAGRDQAIELLRKAVELAPNWLPPRINLAIALLNKNKTEPIAEAEKLLREILQQRDDVPHAHFCLGIILNHRGNKQEAAKHFQRVTELDPSDAFAWYWLGDCYRESDRDRAEECFRQALDRNPYLVAAVYGLQGLLALKGDIEGAKKYMLRKQQLEAAKAHQKAGVIYDEMGPYAYAIGTVPRGHAEVSLPHPPVYAPWAELKVALRDGARWVRESDFDQDPVARAVWRLYTTRGFPWAVFDYDGDGDQDLLLLSAALKDGQITHVLLRNDGGGKFTDVTDRSGLVAPYLAVAVVVGDYDNDLLPDLYICNAGPNLLFHNNGGSFEDVTSSADAAGGDVVSVDAVFVDLDQDADLDLFVANLCPTDKLAEFLDNPSTDQPVQALVLLNTGRPAHVPQRPTANDNTTPRGLTTAFSQHTDQPLCYAGPLTAVTFADIDNDRDVDLLASQPDGGILLFQNDRVLNFTAAPLQGLQVPPHAAADFVVVDFDLNDVPDLVVGPAGQPGILFIGKGDRKLTDYPNSRQDLAWESLSGLPGPIAQPRVADLDLDGRWDVVALSNGAPLWVGMTQRGVVGVRRGLLPRFSADNQPNALVSEDFDDDGFTELVGFVPGKGLVGFKTEGNGNHWVKLRFTGVRNDGEELRSTADAVGTRYLVHAGSLTIIDEIRPRAGGGPSVHGPITLGLANFTQLDGLRIRWADNMIQGEVGLAASQLHMVREVRRKTLSCPVLFTWNGSRYEYVCDFLGGGGLGYLLRPGVYNPPDPDEVLRITGRQLQPVDGTLRIAIAEPMDEVCYLDYLELVAIDHPAGTLVYPDERFAPPENRATGETLCFARRVEVLRALDHHGHDVTEKLRHLDRNAVDDFRLLATWPGYAEDHFVVCSFRVPELRQGQRVFLCLGGWVEYAFSDTNYAAATAGVELKLPAIDVEQPGGGWKEIVPVAGVPAGSPRTMTVELSGLIPTGAEIRLRIRTNAQVYWDEVFLGIADADITVRKKLVPIEAATLLYRGHLQEYSPDGRWPTEFDYARTDPTPLVRQYGYYTRYGPVKELLEEEDDALLIFGAGDAVEITFDARSLPDPPDGWVRTYLLRTVGYCKSADPLTLHPLTVEPLPFRGMGQYPPPEGTEPADPERVRELHSRYNTRYHGPPARTVLLRSTSSRD